MVKTQDKAILLPALAKKAGRIKDATYLRTYILAENVEYPVHFRDALFEVDGMPPRESWPHQYGWAIHGTSSMHDASTYLFREAERQKKLLFELDLWLKIESVKKASATVDEKTARETGLLIAARLKADYRDVVFETMLGYVEETMTRANKALAKERIALIREEWSLDRLLLQYPALIWTFMDRNPWVVAFVHKASVRISPEQSELLQLATFRLDPKLIAGAGVRQDDSARVAF